ncbi:MAG: hypothetical protein SGI83_14155 [Bacteroidota bacterium]|nr:hypothetical protein [Bacteroidota bacterium]
MANNKKLRKGITESEFNNGYWFTHDLKKFAREIGIADSGKLRKDELEKIIKEYIKTGRLINSKRTNLKQQGVKDIALGLTLSLRVKNYTDNKVTKQFIDTETQELRPSLINRSGARYRLNRWREEQINKGNQITYADLVYEYIRLNELSESFKRIEHGRYLNFVTDFLANENKATRAKAIKAWKQLKKSNIPKDYKHWRSDN